MGEPELIPIYIMGQRHRVPRSLTIQKAMEYAGYTLLRGCGCRGGFCGACATVYRVGSDYKLRIGLACQTVVEPEMYLSQIPSFPAPRARYRLEALKPTMGQLLQLYPELLHELVEEFRDYARRGGQVVTDAAAANLTINRWATAPVIEPGQP